MYEDDFEIRKANIEEIKRKEREKEIEDLKKVLSLVEGRRLLWRLMGKAGVFHTSFTGNSTTFFNEGKREIGLLILNEVMNASPGHFTQMQNESVNEQKIKRKQMERVNERASTSN